MDEDIKESGNLGTLTPRNIEEPAARCNICGSGLNYIEYLLYGNRCLFCCESKKNISLFKFLVNALMDFMIYRKTLKWADDKDESGDAPAGRVKFLGYLGAVGCAYYEELTIKQKWELLKDL